MKKTPIIIATIIIIIVASPIIYFHILFDHIRETHWNDPDWGNCSATKLFYDEENDIRIYADTYNRYSGCSPYKSDEINLSLDRYMNTHLSKSNDFLFWNGANEPLHHEHEFDAYNNKDEIHIIIGKHNSITHFDPTPLETKIIVHIMDGDVLDTDEYKLWAKRDKLENFRDWALAHSHLYTPEKQ
jgi:hypothetical protein